MTLVWLVPSILLMCNGQPEPGAVRFAADYGLAADALLSHVEAAAIPEQEVSLFIPLEPAPGEVVFADYYALDEAGNRSDCP